MRLGTKTFRLFTFTFFVLVGMLSCHEEISDPGVCMTQIIENKSEEDLLLMMSESGDLDFVLILSGDEYILCKYGTIGMVRNFGDCEVMCKDSLSLEVESSDSLSVKVNPEVGSSWGFTIIEDWSNGGGTAECRLTIDDEDLE